jgi:hypothetical protein
MVKKKGLKKFNISNKLAYTLMVILSIVLLGIGVYANTVGTAPNPGHLLSTLSPDSSCSSGQVLSWNGVNIVCATPSATDSRFWIGTVGNDRGKLCYNNLYSSCTTQSLYCSKSISSFVDIGPACIVGQDYTSTCQAYCNDNGIPCDGSVSGCSGTSVYWTVGSAICFSGQNDVWCTCEASGYYTQATSIPAGTRCV